MADDKVSIFLDAGAVGAAASVLLRASLDEYDVINCIIRVPKHVRDGPRGIAFTESVIKACTDDDILNNPHLWRIMNSRTCVALLLRLGGTPPPRVWDGKVRSYEVGKRYVPLLTECDTDAVPLLASFLDPEDLTEDVVVALVKANAWSPHVTVQHMVGDTSLLAIALNKAGDDTVRALIAAGAPLKGIFCLNRRPLDLIKALWTYAPGQAVFDAVMGSGRVDHVGFLEWMPRDIHLCMPKTTIARCGKKAFLLCVDVLKACGTWDPTADIFSVYTKYAVFTEDCGYLHALGVSLTLSVGMQSRFHKFFAPHASNMRYLTDSQLKACGGSSEWAAEMMRRGLDVPFERMELSRHARSISSCDSGFKFPCMHKGHLANVVGAAMLTSAAVAQGPNNDLVRETLVLWYGCKPEGVCEETTRSHRDKTTPFWARVKAMQDMTGLTDEALIVVQYMVCE